MAIDERDFDVISPHQVRHRATGATWTRGRTDGGGSSLLVDPGRAGTGNYPTLAELSSHAEAIFQQLETTKPFSGQGIWP